MTSNRPGYHRIRYVASLDELVATPLRDGVNALCWPRQLDGDFAEVAAAVGDGEDILTLDPENLHDLRRQLSPAGQKAIDIMLDDHARLSARGLDPCIDFIPPHPRYDDDPIVRTDVQSFHADRAPVEVDTYLCTYTGASSEALPNEQALRRVDIAETRAALQAQWQREAEGGEDFESYLQAHSYDLHYRPEAGAAPYQFGTGNLWRIAIAWPGAVVPPCIHRAPDMRAGDPPRLLLLS